MPLSPSDEHRNRRDAIILLGKLASTESVAEQWERSPAPDGLSVMLAHAYRRRLGIEPCQRHELRRRVEEIVRDGRRAVAEVLLDLIGQSQKPSSTG